MLTAKGYLPFSIHADGERLLSIKEWHKWPFDIVWHLAPSFLDRCHLQLFRHLHSYIF